MTRRRLLAAAGSATAASLAGCNGSSDRTGQEPTDGSTATDAPTDTSTETTAGRQAATPKAALAAECTVSPAAVSVGDVLTLDASASRNADYVEIDADGDGTIDHVLSGSFVLTYRPTSPGELTPTVVAHGDGGQDSVTCEPVTVSESGAPVARCSVSTTEGTVGEPITIDASASEHATAISVDVDGDGTVDLTDESDFVVEYAPTEVGTLTPTVTAHGGDSGRQDTVECESIHVAKPDAPTARCSVSTTQASVGDTVTIDASASEHATSVRFDLNGDGSVDVVEEGDFVVDYTFPQAGEYTPTVTAKNAAGEDSVDCETISVGETTGEVVEVPPTKTYLRTSNDGAGDAAPVALADLGVSPGDRITLTRLGHFSRGSSIGSAGFGMHGVFSASAKLLGSDELHRVPDAIDAGPAMQTSPTYYGSRPTNVAEDFGIATNDRSVVSATVDVPEGATHLFVAARDDLYEDNSDDPRYAVRIEHTPDASLSEDVDPNESVKETSGTTGDQDGDPPAPETDITIPIDPKATYLHTHGDDAADAEPVNLSSLGIEPGDEIVLVRVGSFTGGQGYGMTALFSRTSTLRPGDERERVPGAVDAGADHHTSSTWHGSEPTDIPEDFLVADHGQTFRSVSVTVPRGANYLFVAAKDNAYGDNKSQGFGVGIAL